MKEQFDLLMEMVDSLLVAFDMVSEKISPTVPVSETPQIATTSSSASLACVMINFEHGHATIAESTTHKSTAADSHVYTLEFHGLRLFNVASFLGQARTYIFLYNDQLSLYDIPRDGGDPILILERTPFPVAPSPQQQVTGAFMISYNRAASDAIGREITADVHVRNVTLHHRVGPSWLFKVMDFAAEPLVRPGVCSIVGKQCVMLYRLMFRMLSRSCLHETILRKYQSGSQML